MSGTDEHEPGPTDKPVEGVDIKQNETVGDEVVRTPNAGLDRSDIIGQGFQWTARWALRFVIVMAALWILEKLVQMFWPGILPVAIALIIATVLWPPTAKLRKIGFPPAAAAATTLVSFFAILIGIVAAITPTVTSQWSDLAKRSTEGVNRIRDWVQGPPLRVSPDQMDNAVKAINDKITKSSDAIASGVFSGVSVATDVLITVAISLVLSFFFIKDGPRFLPWLRTVSGRGAGAHLTEAFSRVWQTLGGFIRTQAIVSAVDSLCIGIGLVVLGVPLALPLVVLTFFGGFIPIVGAFVAGTLAVLVALVTKSVTTAIIVLIIIVLVQQLEGHILQPLLQSRSMSLHPAIVLLAVALGGDLHGITGAFLAVPVAASAAVLFRYVNEQIDLRTGDISASQVAAVSPEGRYAAEAGERHGRALAAQQMPRDAVDTVRGWVGRWRHRG